MGAVITERYLCVGGPLDGQVIEHDGAPMIVEPGHDRPRFEMVAAEGDLAVFRASMVVVLYVRRNVPITSTTYVPVMAPAGVDLHADDVLRSALRALRLTAFTGTNHGG